MKQIPNRLIPFGGFKAMAVWPFLFLRRDVPFTEHDVRHEEIHGRQQREMLLIGFYIAYLLCWLKELVHCVCDKERGQVTDPRYRRRKFMHRVEHSVIFEREAYAMQHKTNYLNTRRPWAWIKF